MLCFPTKACSVKSINNSSAELSDGYETCKDEQQKDQKTDLDNMKRDPIETTTTTEEQQDTNISAMNNQPTTTQ